MDFNLTPALARAYYEQMARCFADFGHMAMQPGESVHLAAASDELGKPMVACPDGAGGVGAGSVDGTVGEAGRD